MDPENLETPENPKNAEMEVGDPENPKNLKLPIFLCKILEICLLLIRNL